VPPIIEVEHITRDYGPHRALDDVSFSLEAGGVVGFLGVNGAGKSTLMRILAGYLEPTAGTARIDGHDVVAEPLAVKSLTGYLPETNPLYPELRVVEFLRYRARLKGLRGGSLNDSVEQALSRCWLTDVRQRIIGQLSKGYRQRVGLAAGLLGDPGLLILDEPTAGLDPNQVRATRQLIAELGTGRTVFLSTHILHEAELLCRQVVIVDHGRIVAVDSPGNLCERSARPRTLLVETDADGRIEQAIAALPEVADVGNEGATAEGGRLLRVTSGPGRDARLHVLRLFVEKGWRLHDLRPEPVRLEDIFAEVTGLGERRAATADEGGEA
jgi:ABC-2 type transport system ATP-binding protein